MEEEDLYQLLKDNEHLALMVVFLSRELSKARILTNQGKCSRCAIMSPDACAKCWQEKAQKDTEEDCIL